MQFSINIQYINLYKFFAINNINNNIINNINNIFVNNRQFSL